MGKTIKISLSYDGCNTLLKAVKEYQKKVKTQTDTLLDRIADELIRQLPIAYGNNHINFVKEKMPDGKYRVVAESEGIAFIEFGAGVYAEIGRGSPYSLNVPFDVYPGSWSKEHAHTWQDEIEKGGGDPLKYRYNRMATNGMFHAVEATKLEIPRIAKEVFG